MKIYTRTGDAGTTSLVGGTRVAKTAPRLEAYGTVDELNSAIGLLLAFGVPDNTTADTLLTAQHRLFDLGAQLATEPESKYQPRGITPADIAALETHIDRLPRATTASSCPEAHPPRPRPTWPAQYAAGPSDASSPSPMPASA